MEVEEASVTLSTGVTVPGLQWIRNLAVAEMAVVVFTVCVRCRLQCGRDLAVAERAAS